jgi:hypothetical protein
MEPITLAILAAAGYYAYEKNKNPAWTPFASILAHPHDKIIALEKVKVTSVPTPHDAVALDPGMTTELVKQVNSTLTTEIDPKKIAAHAGALSDLGHENSASALAAKADAVGEAKALGASDIDVHRHQCLAALAPAPVEAVGWGPVITGYDPFEQHHGGHEGHHEMHRGAHPGMGMHPGMGTHPGMGMHHGMHPGMGMGMGMHPGMGVHQGMAGQEQHRHLTRRQLQQLRRRHELAAQQGQQGQQGQMAMPMQDDDTPPPPHHHHHHHHHPQDQQSQALPAGVPMGGGGAAAAMAAPADGSTDAAATDTATTGWFGHPYGYDPYSNSGFGGYGSIGFGGPGGMGGYGSWGSFGGWGHGL